MRETFLCYCAFPHLGCVQGKFAGTFLKPIATWFHPPRSFSVHELHPESPLIDVYTAVGSGSVFHYFDEERVAGLGPDFG